jgi:transposase
MGLAESTTYSILARYKEHGTVERASGSGRPAELMSKRDRQHLVQEAISADYPSQNRLASKYGISQPYVSKILTAADAHSFKRTKAPSTSGSQQEKQKVKIDRLYRLILDQNATSVSIVMDDESYFEMKSLNIPGNDHYYAHERNDAPPSKKFAPMEKFAPKVLVWIAISDRGLSRPYFAPSTGALNAELYQRKCVTQRLKPFIDSYHDDGEYLFWPDLASCHYAKTTMEVFEELDINVVPRDKNPPNTPQLRPIEDFWGILKQLVYDKGWQAENLEQLKRRIKYCLKKVNMSVVRDMMLHVKSRVRQARAFSISPMNH